MKKLLFPALLVAALVAPRVAAAEPVVLSVTGDTVLVDLGGADGVVEGTELLVLHVVTVKDPVTKETLTDTFPLGSLVVLRAGDHVAEARADAAIARRVRAGDPITIASATTAVVDPWQVAVEDSRRPRTRAGTVVAGTRQGATAAERRADAERLVADAEQVRLVWRATLGQTPQARIALWEELLRHAPGNAYADDIRAELTSLSAQAALLDAAANAQPEDRAVVRARALAAIDPRVRGQILVGAPPTHARGGLPVALAFLVVDPDEAAVAWLYARRQGHDGYRRLPLRADGDGYLRGEIPAELAAAPGVEFFVEAGPAGGEVHEVVGAREAPHAIEIADATEPPMAVPGRSRITMTGDYVDFDGGLSKGYDQYQQLEIDFMYRFEKPIYALRLGLGTLSGTGGPKDVIDEDPMDRCIDTDTGRRECRDLSFTYVYTEVELKASKTVSVLLRPQIGRLTFNDDVDGDVGDCFEGEPGTSCEISNSGGFRGRVRIGAERETNLTLGFSFTNNIGTLLEAAYQWAPRPKVPVLLAVQVTDMPVPEDFGVRIVGDIGWRELAWVYPSLRLSYQARDVDHAGFSGGLGLNFDW